MKKYLVGMHFGPQRFGELNREQFDDIESAESYMKELVEKHGSDSLHGEGLTVDLFQDGELIAVHDVVVDTVRPGCDNRMYLTNKALYACTPALTLEACGICH